MPCLNTQYESASVIRGRRRELGLGAAGLVSLAEARELALANRKTARSGGDPLSEKRRAADVPTFAEAAERVLEQKRGGWRGRWHAKNWWWSMERYVFPCIGSRPVSEVNTADVLEILSPIWHAKAATAKEVRQRVRSVLEWAVALDLRNDNPCDRVVPVLGPQNDIVTHRQALAILDAARSLGDGNRLVFPMRSGRSIASSTFPKMLQYHEVAAVPHGFRSSFRDWAAEETDHPREVIEAALAHVVQNKVEAAYARSDLFERRRRLMNDWSEYLARKGR